MGKRRQLILSDVGSKELKNLALHSPSPKIRQRCNIILLNTCGFTNVQIQKELGCSSKTITSILDRYEFKYPFEGLKCLQNAAGGGRKAVLQDSDRMLVINAVQSERQRLGLAKTIIENAKGVKLSKYQVTTFLKSLVGNTSE